MRSNRRRNWLIKRIALGFAVAAFVAPVAQARVDVGSSLQGNGYQAFVTDFPADPASNLSANHLGWPGINPSDYALNRGDQIEVVRVEQPRSTGSEVLVAGYRKPHALGGALARGDSQASWSTIASILAARRPATDGTGFNWKDAGIGAGVVLGLVLLGGGAALASRHVGRAQTA